MRYLAEPDSDNALTPLQAASLHLPHRTGATRRAESAELAKPAGQPIVAAGAPTRTVSAYMARCAVAPISASNLSTCAAISPARRLPMNGSSLTTPAKWCCNLKSAYPDGTPHVVISPLEFMQRLGAHWCRVPGCT